jgi:hypothetical protein
MEKLGIIRDDVTPVSKQKNGELFFDCDNEETGDASMVKKAEESIKNEDSLRNFISKK